MTGHDPKRSCRKMLLARLTVLCRRHDDWCYTAKLHLMPRDFNRMRGGRANSITFLNSRARSSEISSKRPNAY